MSKPTKKAASGTPQAQKAETIKVTQEPGETKGSALARIVSSPALQGGHTIQGLLKNNGWEASLAEYSIGYAEQMGALQNQYEKYQSEGMGLAESTLIAQAQTLDVIFNVMAQRASSNMGHSLDVTERYMRMAMKAQSQCRATLETLAEIKNPRVAVFATQANVTSGPQQVNNSTSVHAHEKTQAPIKMTNELLEPDHGQRLDTGTKSQASRGNQALETVGTKHRTQNRNRQERE